MKRSFSFDISCVSNIYMLKFFRTCKSKNYLKALLMIIEKCLFMSRRRLDYLKLFLYKGLRLGKIMAKVKSRGYQIKEKTILDDSINKHVVCFKMHSAFKVLNTYLWYLDSGCSRHMTGDRTLFKEFESKKTENVTFGDGSKFQIKEKGIICLPGLSDNANVLYVEGLRVNLLSTSQICDQDFMVLFSKGKCLVLNELGEQLISGICTLDNCYGLVPDAEIVCNSIRMPNENLWHQRMGNASYKQLSIMSKNDVVLGMPKRSNVINAICGPCQLGKQTKAQHHATLTTAMARPLELLHVNLMGPTRTESHGGKKYIMVMVYDFTRFTWVILLRSKSKALHHIELLCKRVENEKGLKVDQIQSDHGKEFENSQLESFCTSARIAQEFSAPITPQQNGVVERKNRVIQEMTRAMLHNKDVAKDLWREVVNTTRHIVNQVYFKLGTKKTPYEPNVKYFKIFCSTCFI